MDPDCTGVTTLHWEKRYRGERGKMGHVLYGTNTITKKVINVCQYKNRVYSDHHNDDGDEFF